MTGRPADPGLDADLATSALRAYVERKGDGETAVMGLVDCVEAELARLREELDALRESGQRWAVNVRHKEAECARLQQALRAFRDEFLGQCREVGMGDDEAAACLAEFAKDNGFTEALAGPDTPAESEWFIPEGDRTCGVVHKDARATCMKRRGHDGSHGTPQGTWIDGPWCEYPAVTPADSQEDKT